MASAFGRAGVATQFHLATMAGIKTLEEGGNAFDAVIAASSVLTIALPHTGDLGGDAFMLARLESGEIVAYNASGRSPGGFDEERFLREKPERGPLTVTVPGLVDAWDRLLEYARLPLERLIRKAIVLAENGIPVPPPLAYASKRLEKEMRRFPAWNRSFANLEPGAVYKTSEKAHVLRIIARRGPRAFYENEANITSTLAEELVSQGVPISTSDFARHRGEDTRPLKMSLSLPDGEVLVYELPPNSQGHASLQIIATMHNIANTLDPWSNTGLYARVVEAAYKYRDTHLGDPEHMEKTVGDLEKEIILNLRDETFNTNPSRPLKSGDTTFLTAVDRWGNHVGFIQSLYYPFGSGIMASGILFQNRGYGFSLEKGLPNSPAPLKRPLHTLSIMMLETGQGDFIIGCAGGDLRPQIHANILNNLLKNGWRLDKALEAPRIIVTTRGKKLTRTLLTESMSPATSVEGYETRKTCPTPSTGIVQASSRLPNGLIEVAADARSTGVALSL